MCPRWARPLLALLPLLVGGCTDEDDGEPPDASVPEADAPITPPEPTQPQPPALPRMTPCPAGWREEADPGVEGLVVCLPYPEGGPLECPIDQAHFPGAAGCALVGTPCPEGDWAEDVSAEGTVRFVHPDAAIEGADGTRAHPYPTIARALRVARDGDVVALARGVYEEAVTLDDDVTLWGACVGETLITSAEPRDLPAVQVTSRGGGLRNLRIEGDQPGVWIWSDAGPTTVESVVVAGARLEGINAMGGLVGRDLVVRETRQDAVDGAVAIGVWMNQSSLERTVVSGAEGWGVVVGNDARLEAVDLAVLGTRAMGTDDRGIGITAISFDQGTPALALERAAVVGSGNAAVWLEDAEVLLTDVAVVGTASGIEMHAGAHATASRVVLDALNGRAIALFGARLEATDLVLRDVTGATDPYAQAPLGLALDASTAVIDRCAIARCERVGILALGIDTDLEVNDLLVQDTRTLPHVSTSGRGLEASFHAVVHGQRVSVADNRGFGVIALDNGTVVELQDVSVTGTQPAPCDPGPCDEEPAGFGLAAYTGARVSATTFRADDNALGGATVGELSQIELHDGEVARNEIGVNVQEESYDLSLLQDRVLYVDNGRNLDARRLPVPGQTPERPPPPEVPDVPAGIHVEVVGAPVWDLVDPHLFVAPTGANPDDGLFEATLSALLDPLHTFDPWFGIVAGVPHDAPYEREMADGLAAAGFRETTDLTVEEFEPPNGAVLAWTLVPGDGAPLGSSPDFDRGPILAEEVFPIRTTGVLFRDGVVFDADWDVARSSLAAVAPELQLEGWSHLPDVWGESFAYAPEGVEDPRGDYVGVLWFRDATGAGWDVFVRFSVR